MKKETSKKMIKSDEDKQEDLNEDLQYREETFNLKTGLNDYE